MRHAHTDERDRLGQMSSHPQKSHQEEYVCYADGSVSHSQGVTSYTTPASSCYLSPSGAVYTVTTPVQSNQDSRQHHATFHALSAHRTWVGAALAFRTEYATRYVAPLVLRPPSLVPSTSPTSTTSSASPPNTTPAYMKPDQTQFGMEIRLQSQLIHARWPIFQSASESIHMKESSSSSYNISTVDQFATCTLSENGLLYKSSFPVGQWCGDEDVKSNYHLYTFIQHSGLVLTAPEWLHYPLSVLLHRKKLSLFPGFPSFLNYFSLDANSKASSSFSFTPPPGANYIVSMLPQSNQHTSLSDSVNALFKPNPHQSILILKRSDGIVYYLVNRSSHRMNDDHPPSTASSPTMPLCVFVVLPDGEVFQFDGCYIFLLSTRCVFRLLNEQFGVSLADATTDVNGVEEDETALSSSSSTTLITYKVSMAPRSVHHPVSGQLYPLASIIQTCLFMYTQAISANPLSSNISSFNPPQATARSEEIHELLNIPDIGVFTAYKDRRVSVIFSDRTLLKMSVENDRASSHSMTLSPSRENRPHSVSLLSILDRKGDTHTLRAGNPIGFERYAKLALDFAAWAYSPPETRASQSRAKKVAEETRRRIVMRSATYEESQALAACMRRVRERNARFVLNDEGD